MVIGPHGPHVPVNPPPRSRFIFWVASFAIGFVVIVYGIALVTVVAAERAYLHELSRP